MRIQSAADLRYQYSNHLGSACLELDDAAEIISYEEFHPYGTSAYRLMKSGLKRRRSGIGIRGWRGMRRAG